MADARAFLHDVREAADAIGRFVDGLDGDSYAASEITRAAVERKFEVIGEALAQLSRIAPEIAARVPGHRAVIAFRNILIHAYARVDDARVLAIARTSLPELRMAVAALLDELRDG